MSFLFISHASARPVCSLMVGQAVKLFHITSETDFGYEIFLFDIKTSYICLRSIKKTYTMKRILLTMLLAIVCSAGFAQLSFNGKIGLNLSSYIGDGSDGAKFKPGVRVGLGMEYAFNDLVALQPSLFFSQKGAVYDSGNVGVGNLASASDEVKVNQLYLEIPVNVQFRFDVADNIDLLFATGPYLACGVGGKIRNEVNVNVGGFGGSDTRKINTFGDDGSGMNRFDAGWGVGIGLDINRILVGLDTQFGFCELYDYGLHNANISITVGYRF